MRKLTATPALAIGAFVLVGPSPAYAANTCKALIKIKQGPPDSASAACTGSQGQFRIRIGCVSNPSDLGTLDFYWGSWVGSARVSAKSYSSQRPYILRTAVERSARS
ncbi:hypothetical protein ACTWPT_52135 [Nonomuraea sp. 3N208]|uniref:hypothetical protein n=1 Tax=Nonomuraea sp. 3N208 TaxID=3457421 RepID=UPI003FD1F603